MNDFIGSGRKFGQVQQPVQQSNIAFQELKKIQSEKARMASLRLHDDLLDKFRTTNKKRAPEKKSLLASNPLEQLKKDEIRMNQNSFVIEDDELIFHDQMPKPVQKVSEGHINKI